MSTNFAVIVKYLPATNTKGSRSKATLITPGGKTVTATVGSYSAPVGSTPHYEAAVQCCAKAGMRLVNTPPLWYNNLTEIYTATRK